MFSFLGICAWITISQTLARAAPPVVESVVPAAGQRGTEFTLTLKGARLGKPQELMLYSPGVACTKLVAHGENEVVATLKAEPQCRLGEYPFRLRTSGGVSEVRTFHITPFPVIMEQEPNDEFHHAQILSLNTTVAGGVEAGEVDHFAVSLTKGQRLAAEVVGIRLGADLTDTALSVFGPDGKELATNDDNPLFRQDPFVTLVAPSDGVYVIQVRETNDSGGEKARYLLHVGTFCRPAAVFPAGGPCDSEMTVTWFGDASGSWKQTLKLPAAGTPFDLYPSDGKSPTPPTPHPFRVSPFPNVLEREPNDQTHNATANPHGWPVAFNGIIEKAGDVDHFRFRAAQGDIINIEAFAYRIGSPLDPVVAVLYPDGEVLAANDDDETHDSRLTVHIPADGEYFLRISDKRQQGRANFIYRVELSQPTPRLTVFLAPPLRKTQERTAIAVPRGNRVLAFLGVQRQGVTGPIRITPGELPAGVKLSPATVTVADGEYLVPVVLEAAADAPLGGLLIPLIARLDDPSSPVPGSFLQRITLVRGPADTALHTVELDRLAVVVTEEVPFGVEIVPPTTPLAVDSTLEATVKVTRAADFNEPLEISFPSLPPGVECPKSVVIPPEAHSVNVTIVAGPHAEPGDWKLVAEVQVARSGRGTRDPLSVGMAGTGSGSQRGDGRRSNRRGLELLPVASAVTPIRVVSAAIEGRFEPAVSEQGATTRVICHFARPTPVAFTAKLDGLPPRSVAPVVFVPAGARQVEFHVTIDPTTPVGTVERLVCELTGIVEGQKVIYRVGRGGSLRIDPPGWLRKDATGKPLSPLEILRQRQNSSKKP